MAEAPKRSSHQYDEANGGWEGVAQLCEVIITYGDSSKTRALKRTSGSASEAGQWRRGCRESCEKLPNWIAHRRFWQSRS